MDPYHETRNGVVWCGNVIYFNVTSMGGIVMLLFLRMKTVVLWKRGLAHRSDTAGLDPLMGGVTVALGRNACLTSNRSTRSAASPRASKRAAVRSRHLLHDGTMRYHVSAHAAAQAHGSLSLAA